MSGTRTEAQAYLDHCWEQSVKPDVRRLAELLGDGDVVGRLDRVRRALRSEASDSDILAAVEEITDEATEARYFHEDDVRPLYEACTDDSGHSIAPDEFPRLRSGAGREREAVSENREDLQRELDTLRRMHAPLADSRRAYEQSRAELRRVVASGLGVLAGMVIGAAIVMLVWLVIT